MSTSAKKDKWIEIYQDYTNIRSHLKENKSNPKSKILLKLIEMNAQNGASAALAVIPLSQYGFTLHSQEFRDMLSVRYNITIPDLSKICACGKSNDLQHAVLAKWGDSESANIIRPSELGAHFDSLCRRSFKPSKRNDYWFWKYQCLSRK